MKRLMCAGLATLALAGGVGAALSSATLGTVIWDGHAALASVIWD